MIFQDPYGSLDPRHTVETIVAEPLIGLAHVSRPERRARVVETLAAVGLDADAADKYPHEFSGGQRQRIAIARALVTKPEARRRRRAGVGARRLDPGAGAQRDDRPAARRRRHLSADQSRSRRRRPYLRRDRRDVSWPLRRDAGRPRCCCADPRIPIRANSSTPRRSSKPSRRRRPTRRHVLKPERAAPTRRAASAPSMCVLPRRRSCVRSPDGRRSLVIVAPFRMRTKARDRESTECGLTGIVKASKIRI